MSLGTYRSGRFTAAIKDCAVVPHTRTAKPLVVYLGAQPTEVMGGANSARLIAKAIANTLGYPVVSPTITTMWGNATVMARITAAVAWGRANLGATSAPVRFVGISQGALAALNWAAANPADTACLAAVIPMFDLDDVRDNNLGGYQASVDAAWGVTYPAALPAGANPADNASNFTSLPIQGWYATDDAIVRPTQTLAAATAFGATMTSVGALGHTEAAVAAASIPGILTLLT